MSVLEKQKALDAASKPHQCLLSKCPKGADCETLKRQAALIQELELFRADFCDLKAAVQEVVTTFNDAKTVVQFIGKAGSLLRWLAITIAAAGTIWAAITNWPKS